MDARVYFSRAENTKSAKCSTSVVHVLHRGAAVAGAGIKLSTMKGGGGAR